MEGQQNERGNQPQTESSFSLFNFRFHVINSSTATESVRSLLIKVICTSTFAISAQKCVGNDHEFLITIELLYPRRSPSDVILFYLNRLPLSNVDSFDVTRMLLKLIFIPNRKFHGWDFNKQHLDAFVSAGYLLQTDIDQINLINLQDRFKQWYNQTFKHNQNCPVSSSSPESQNDDLCCTCPYRPYKKVTDKWCISKTTLYVFRQRLIVLNRTNINQQRFNSYCLVLYQVTFKRLLMIVEFNWNLTQLAQFIRHLRNKNETISTRK